jgi:RNA polymerase sigma-70 factor (ECF subfamily)
LTALNERERDIIIKTRVEGFTNKEVAGQLDMTETAVKVAGHRALKKLKKRYKKAA